MTSSFRARASAPLAAVLTAAAILAIVLQAASARADSGTATVTAATCLNLRTAPSLSADILTCMPPGTAVTLSGESRSAEGYAWSRVSVDGRTGWAASSYLASAVAAAAPAEFTYDARVAAMPDCLNLRDVASLWAPVLACIPGGTSLTVLGGTSRVADGHTWAWVRVEGVGSGYVAAEYLVAPAAPAVATVAQTGTVSAGTATAPVSGRALSEAQMDAILDQVGWPAATRAAAKAVAWCESGWRPDATGSAGERGLWQIHPVWGSLSTYDPAGNARAALQISKGGTDWRAWSCAKAIVRG